MEQQWVGINVCQKYLDVYIRPSGKLFQLTNDDFGIAESIQTLKEITHQYPWSWKNSCYYPNLCIL